MLLGINQLSWRSERRFFSYVHHGRESEGYLNGLYSPIFLHLDTELNATSNLTYYGNFCYCLSRKYSLEMKGRIQGRAGAYGKLDTLQQEDNKHPNIVITFTQISIFCEVVRPS